MIGNLKFVNPSGVAKVWGAAKPKTFELIFEYLISEGFVPEQKMGKDPHSLACRKDIDESLCVVLDFSSGAQLSEDVYSFDCSIIVCSKYISSIDKLINIWDRNFEQIEWGCFKDITSIYVVDLSHLKWNEVTGNNPRWTLTNGRASQIEANAWVVDWNRYGKPWAERFKSPQDVYSYLIHLDAYKKSHWVKSDGPRSSNKFVFAVLLLAQMGRKDEACKLLNSFLEQLGTANHKGLYLSRSDVALNRALLKIRDWLSDENSEVRGLPLQGFGVYH
ncbi:MAG: hypothetical protein PHP85_05910 [Gallionella sp.]|nr:hypothetical protein [Gallionella sp.]